MVVILKYSIRNNLDFCKILENLNLDFTFTLNEAVITKASHIILPDTFNVNTAIRKMQLMNLFSMLRMIKKPMLGINNGFSLMCNNMTDIQKYGLGLFPINSKTYSLNEEEKKQIGKIDILKKTKLFNNVNTKTINCNLKGLDDVNDFTTSTITNGTKQFSLTCENKNYYSIQMDLSSNQKLFEKLIGNFVTIKTS